MKSLIRFFNSVQLAIVLLIIITLASILGTLIPQNRTMAEYTLHYGQLANVLVNLEITKLYQSVWYVGLLLLFSLNLIVCTLTRLTPKWRRAFNPKIENEAKNLTALKIHTQFSKKWNPEKAKKELGNGLNSHKYKVREESHKAGISLLARKKTSGLFGADIVHLGLLIILAGAIFSGMTSIGGDITLTEGQIQPVPHADFQTPPGSF